ncbi:prolactin-inducible protein precursor, partial [Daubentonia madagascariensis]
RVMIMDIQVPSRANANELITLKLTLQTELRECMVVKAYLRSNTTMDGSFNHVFTSCLCEDYPRNLFWNFKPKSSMIITAVVDVIRELNICPNDKAVIPINANRFYTSTSLLTYK